MALGADGPGYYNARNAVETVQRNEKKNKAILSDIRLEAADAENRQIILINTIFELLKTIELNWTDKQREIIWDMLCNQGGQAEAALRLGIIQSYVQKVLAKGRYYVYEKALKDVGTVLGELTNVESNL